MFVWLLLLIACGVVTAVIAIFSSVEEKGRKNDNFTFQGAIERALRQIKDQLFQVEIDVKKSTRLTSKLRDDIQVIKEKDYSSFAEVLLEKDPVSTTEGAGSIDQIPYIKAQQKVKVMELENLTLRKRVESMSLEIDDLLKEKDSLGTLVSQLKEREKRIQAQLNQMQKDFQELKSGLNEATNGKFQMKEKLFKLKVASSDNDKELKRLRIENKELFDSLSFERKS